MLDRDPGRRRACSSGSRWRTTIPARLDAIHELRERYPLRADEPSRIGDVLRTGESQVIQVDRRLAARDRGRRRPPAAAARDRDGSVLAVPMSAGGAVAGALVFVNHEGSRRFDDHDRVIAEEVARRVALAIESARLAEERAHVADALQRELLPPSLPPMPGWEVATMYEPAGEVNEVGGDFYEVFPVEGGWAVVLGDVSGKGAAAAALTAEARHTIRTAGIAHLRPDPRPRGPRPQPARARRGRALLGRDAGPPGRRVERRRGQRLPRRASLSDPDPPGRPRRAGRQDRARCSASSTSPPGRASRSRSSPGDQLVLYTDGVIEARRDGGGERFGTERLRQGLAGCGRPDDAVDRVRGALWEFGARARDDDAALVAIRRTGSGPGLGRGAVAVAAGAQRVEQL